MVVAPRWGRLHPSPPRHARTHAHSTRNTTHSAEDGGGQGGGGDKCSPKHASAHGGRCVRPHPTRNRVKRTTGTRGRGGVTAPRTATPCVAASRPPTHAVPPPPRHRRRAGSKYERIRTHTRARRTPAQTMMTLRRAGVAREEEGRMGGGECAVFNPRMLVGAGA